MNWPRWPGASLAKGDTPSPSTPGKRLLHHRWVKSSNSHRNSGNSDTSMRLKCGKINKAAPLSQRSKQRRGGGNPAACLVCIFPTRFTLNLDKKSQKAGLREHQAPLLATAPLSIRRLPGEGIGGDVHRDASALHGAGPHLVAAWRAQHRGTVQRCSVTILVPLHLQVH